MSSRLRAITSSLVIVALAVGWVASRITAAASETFSEGEADVALVLGASVWSDAPSPVFQARIDHALDLYHSGRADRVLFTGGSRSDTVRTESSVARDYALAAGIPPEDIDMEERSLTTAQNLACIQPILRQLEAESVVLVSDPLHLWRARWMAEDLGISVSISPTPTSRYQSLGARSRFLARETYFSFVYAIQRFAGPPECPEG